jgi:virulence-associated protein VapD
MPLSHRLLSQVRGGHVPHTSAWKQYQDDVADFLKRLGFETQTDEVIQGARASHAVDVTARMTIAGVRQLWIVKCKDWRRRIPKERVLTFRGVVEDIGADRGPLFSENGFQAGAISAARNTNTTLTSISEFEEDLASEVASTRARVLDEHIARMVKAFMATWDLAEAERERVWSRYVGPSGFTHLQGTPHAIVGVTSRLSQLRQALEDGRFDRWPVALFPLDHRDGELLDVTAWEGLFFVAEHMITTCERIYEHMIATDAVASDWRDFQPEELTQLLRSVRSSTDSPRTVQPGAAT